MLNCNQAGTMTNRAITLFPSIALATKKAAAEQNENIKTIKKKNSA